ncbi:hypothetical protein ACQR1I_19710 [Bradyrhizobium sp. HKCCYLS2038]|uniref:hypothetical protein n=1 Tax=Bradyrhizobium sp. HKCCYLS2038 TaxID=3420764 RepID=UPI003EB84B0A
MRFATVLVLSFAISLASYAAAAAQGVSFDAIAAWPGAQITTTTNNDGSEVKVVKLPNGVVFRQERRNGKTLTFGNDTSGHGAVMCSWNIYVIVAAALEICPEFRNEPLKTDLAGAIDMINDFIVANSLSAVSKAELEQRAASVRKDVPQLCRSDSVAGMIKAFGSMSHDKFTTSVADLLSVPRPPVTNPCL